MLMDYTVMSIDVGHGFQQQVITSAEDGNLIIYDLLVKDYPTIIRLNSTKYIFQPSTLKINSL